MISVVVETAQVPPTFIPVGTDLHRTPIESDGIFGHAAFARRGRLLCNSLKVICGRGTRLRQGCWSKHQSDENYTELETGMSAESKRWHGVRHDWR